AFGDPGHARSACLAARAYLTLEPRFSLLSPQPAYSAQQPEKRRKRWRAGASQCLRSLHWQQRENFEKSTAHGYTLLRRVQKLANLFRGGTRGVFVSAEYGFPRFIE